MFGMARRGGGPIDVRHGWFGRRGPYLVDPSAAAAHTTLDNT